MLEETKILTDFKFHKRTLRIVSLEWTFSEGAGAHGAHQLNLANVA